MEHQTIFHNGVNKIQNLITLVAILIIISCLLPLSSCAGWSRAPYYDDKGHGRSYSGNYYDNVKNYDKSFHPGWRFSK